MRYFVRIVERGSMSRAAQELNLVQSALSQQISRLEGELATRLLHRSPRGVRPTEAGVAFYREAQLVLRHAEQAKRVAQQSRISGSVRVGLAPTTSSVLGLALLTAMRQRYADVQLQVVESLSGHLTEMLNARQLDLAVLFDTAAAAARRLQIYPLLQERLFFVQPIQRPFIDPMLETVRLSSLSQVPLLLPSGLHGLRSVLQAAFGRARVTPLVVAEIDGLALLMDAVEAGLGATIQPWSAMGRYQNLTSRFTFAEISNAQVHRDNILCALSDDELSPAAHATRIVLTDCVHKLVESGGWRGAQLIPAVEVSDLDL